MAHQRQWSLASLVLAFVIAGGAMAAPGGRGVETQTIIVPPDASGEPASVNEAMPRIPGSADSPAPPPGTATPEPAKPSITPDTGVLPTVEYDPSKLPPPVRRLREQIMEAATSGDIEKLRPIIEANGDEPPTFSFDETGDPIDYLKSLSGDPDGREILAILTEVLEAGYVHVDTGTPDEVYLWPYFARYPVDKLTPKQMVELFKLVYSGDYDDMKAAGEYLFYRLGIAPDGTWKFFISGD